MPYNDLFLATSSGGVGGNFSLIVITIASSLGHLRVVAMHQSIAWAGGAHRREYWACWRSKAWMTSWIEISNGIEVTCFFCLCHGISSRIIDQTSLSGFCLDSRAWRSSSYICRTQTTSSNTNHWNFILRFSSHVLYVFRCYPVSSMGEPAIAGMGTSLGGNLWRRGSVLSGSYLYHIKGNFFRAHSGGCRNDGSGTSGSVVAITWWYQVQNRNYGT